MKRQWTRVRAPWERECMCAVQVCGWGAHVKYAWTHLCVVRVCVWVAHVQCAWTHLCVVRVCGAGAGVCVWCRCRCETSGTRVHPLWERQRMCVSVQYMCVVAGV